MPMNPRLLRPLATGFDPRRIANLGLWLDASADSSLTLNGSTVSEWRDLSGQARHFSQGAALNQPSATAATQNGLRVLDFDGFQALVGNAASFSLARNVPGLSMFVVQKAETLSADMFLFYASRTTAASKSLVAYQHATSSFITGGRRLEADAFASVGFTANTNASVLAGVLDYANSDAFIYESGTLRNSTTSFQTDGNSSDSDSLAARIGANSASPLSYLNGWIAEIVVYQRALATGERQRVERYLGRKWGITVA